MRNPPAQPVKTKSPWKDSVRVSAGPLRLRQNHSVIGHIQSVNFITNQVSVIDDSTSIYWYGTSQEFDWYWEECP